LATRNSAALQQAGFHTGTPNSANTTATTVIEYPAGMESQAKAVAAYVPGAQVAASTAVNTVTLVLGTDGKQVKGLAASVPPSQAPAPASSASQPTVRTAAQVGCIN
jgi:hypothetical protein